MSHTQILKNKKNGKTHVLRSSLSSDGELLGRKVTCGKINVLEIDFNKYEVLDYDLRTVNCQQCLRFKSSIIWHAKDYFY